MRGVSLLLTSVLAIPVCAAAQRQDIGAGGPALRAKLMFPVEMVIDREGNYYLSERIGHRVRRIDARTGVIMTIAGTGVRGYSGDGGLATAAQFEQLGGLAFDSAGNLYIGDLWNHRIRKVDLRTGIVTTAVGNGTPGFSGDGGPARQAGINGPFDIAFDAESNLFFTDTENHRIRRVDARTGVITTVAGTGRWGPGGDGGPATNASLSRPHCVIIAQNRDIYLCDSFSHLIRRIDGATGRISTIAGNGYYGGAGDGGQATDAAITYVGDLLLDRIGDLLFTDIATHRIRKVDLRTGVISTVAGSGRWEFGGDGGPALQGSFHLPNGLQLDRDGNLLVMDSWNGRVRRIDARTGTLSTFAGSAATEPTPDWNFHVHYDFTALQALNNRPVALMLPGTRDVSVQSITYARSHGAPGRARVLTPPGSDPAARGSVVVLLHSRTNQEVRPYQSGGLNSWARLIAASGMTAVLPDTRLGASQVSAELATQDLREVLQAVGPPERLCFLAFGDGIAPVTALLGEGRKADCVVAFYPTVNVEDQRLFAWSAESEDVRRTASLLRLAQNARELPPILIARGARDRPEINEPLARLEELASARGLPITFTTHSQGGTGFERLLGDEEAVRAVQIALDFLRANPRRVP